MFIMRVFLRKSKMDREGGEDFCVFLDRSIEVYVLFWWWREFDNEGCVRLLVVLQMLGGLESEGWRRARAKQISVRSGFGIGEGVLGWKGDVND